MDLVQASTSQETTPDLSSRNIEVIQSPKWVRVSFAGELIADSKDVILLL